MAQNDFDTNVAAKVEIERLLQLGEEHGEMIADLLTLLQEANIPDS